MTGHTVSSVKWNEDEFQDRFSKMEDLVKAMAFNSSDEGKIVGELKDWRNKGDFNDILWFCALQQTSSST